MAKYTSRRGMQAPDSHQNSAPGYSSRQYTIRRIYSSLALGIVLMGFGATFPAITTLPHAQAQDVQSGAVQGIEKFATSNPQSTYTIDYAQVDELVAAVSVQSRGRLNFRYDVMRQAGIQFLDRYINFLTQRDPVTFSRNEQLAYWLNLRNMLIIKMISNDDPGSSLNNERGTYANPGPEWSEKIVTISGVDLSLDDIERKILAKNWPQQNLIYGLYQGIRGSTAYPETCFRGGSVNEQLNALASDYINNRSTVSAKKEDLKVAGIYEWYRDDFFDGDDQVIIAHIKEHAEEKLQKKLTGVSALSFKKISYRLDAERARAISQTGFGAGGIGGGGGGVPSSGS